MMAWMTSQFYRSVFRTEFADRYPQGTLWAVSLLTALLVFGSVILHELGHCIAAVRQGVKVHSINLFLLGGVADIDRECPTAIGSLWVAAAGPLVSFVVSIILITSSHAASHLSSLLGVVASLLGYLNLGFAIFNLLPGLPLDGGLILKALVWQVTGSRQKGIHIASTAGKTLAFIGLGLGALWLFAGISSRNPAASVSGFILLILGMFWLSVLRNQSQMLALQGVLRRLQVKDAAQRRYRVLEANTKLRELSRLRVSDEKGLADWLLVCDQGRWKGFITDAPLQSLPVQRWDEDSVGDHLQPLDQLPSIGDGAPLWQAILQLDQPGVNRLLVLGPAGLPTGTLERPELAERVLKELGVRLPLPILEAARRQGVYPLGMMLAPVARTIESNPEG